MSEEHSSAFSLLLAKLLTSRFQKHYKAFKNSPESAKDSNRHVLSPATALFSPVF